MPNRPKGKRLTVCPDLPAGAGEIINYRTRERWLAARGGGRLGASDCSSLFGFGFKSEYRLWADFVDPPTEKDNGSNANRLRRGRLLENFIVRECQDLRPDWSFFQWPQTQVVHHRGGHLSCTPDALVIDSDGELCVLEIKTAMELMKKKWDDGPPPGYTIQVQAQLACLGLNRAYIAVMFGLGGDLVISPVERHTEFIAKLEYKAQEFHLAVKNRVAPEADGSSSTREAIARLYANADGTAVDLPVEGDYWAKDLALAKADAKSAKAKVEGLTNQIKAAIGSATWARCGSGEFFSLKKSETRRLDTTSLREDHPDLADEYTNTTTSRTLRVVKAIPEDAC